MEEERKLEGNSMEKENKIENSLIGILVNSFYSVPYQFIHQSVRYILSYLGFPSLFWSPNSEEEERERNTEDHLPGGGDGGGESGGDSGCDGGGGGDPPSTTAVAISTRAVFNIKRPPRERVRDGRPPQHN